MKTYKYTINGNDYEVVIESDSEETAMVTVNGEAFEVVKHVEEAEEAPATTAARHTDDRSTAASSSTTESGAPVGNGKSITAIAPLPGVIVSIQVKAGDVVKRGQCLAVLEAMKMENNIEADTDGTVTAIHVKEGDSVLEGAPLISLQ